ncbi:uncharacterized protein C2845_PM17G07680 [Panicum miliaceum]|uniref:Retroviral polymerase SH3-like domain-containing protein n=1 Tax=Panicum miliaceum TaxID=4540 RepID=A0A3L6Q290_PANMI|nr:uncharacterized protein C2845_PM17G07680 [Panicum miliaceum]
MCVFLGYSAHHKGYCCLDTLSNRVIISHHVTFDESAFPFAELQNPPTPAAFDFLDDLSNSVPAPKGPTLPLVPASSTALPRAALGIPPGTSPAPAPSAPTGAPGVLGAHGAPPGTLAGAPGAPVGTTGASGVPAGAPGALPATLGDMPVVSPSTAARSPLPAVLGTASPSAPAGPAPTPAVPPPLRVYKRRAGPSPPVGPAVLPKGVAPVPAVTNQHPMTTRAKLGFRVPSLYLAAPLSPVPKTFRSALIDPNWRAAMEEEHAALLKNHTWDLVPRPPRANVVSGKWIFKHKFLSDGSLERYKARWVLRGFT